MREQVLKLRKVLAEKGIDAYMASSPRSRKYISGFTGTAGYAVVTQDLTDLVTDFRYFEQVALEAPEFDLVKIGDDYKIEDYIKEKGFNIVAFEENVMTAAEYLNLREKCPQVEFIFGSKLLCKIRQIKTAEEIAGHKKSCEVTNQIVEDFFNYARIGMTEKELHDYVIETSRKYGAEAQNFDPITLIGENSSFCHGKPTERRLQEGDFLLLDMGVVYNGYASDVTRTAVMGKASEKQKEIYEIVRYAQKVSIENIKVGMSAYEAHRISQDIIDAAGYGECYQHGVGHGFGDELGIRAREEDKATILQENMVFTVEPGIYIPGFGGVRIEDDVVLTKDGCVSFCTYGTELRELEVR